MSNELVRRLKRDKKFVDLYILGRYFYRIGEPILTDHEYNLIENCFKGQIEKCGGLVHYFERTYDDDPIPYALLHKYGLEDYIIEVSQAEYSVLEEDKSLSIRAVEVVEDAYAYIQEKRKSGNLKMIFSAKADGVNTKTLYLGDKSVTQDTFKDLRFKVSLSRGRRGNSFVFDKTITKCIPVVLKNTISAEAVVYAEALVEKEYLDVLKVKYGRLDSFKTCKSSAISMLRVLRDNEDYKHLHVFAFSAEGIDTTYSGTLEKLRESGFEIVPYKTVYLEEIPSDFEEFKIWLEGIMDWIWDESKKAHLFTDGMVIDVDDKLFEDNVKQQYSDRNIAVKFGHWQSSLYKGVVVENIIEQQQVDCSCRCRIEDVYMNDDCVAKYVNTFNPDIVIRENILPGSTIYFKRKSQTVNVLVYGDELKQLLGEV